jgi:hypothetical protein
MSHTYKSNKGCLVLTVSLEDAEDLATSDALNERNTVLVTEEDTDLRRHLTLLRSLRNHLVHLQGKSKNR